MVILLACAAFLTVSADGYTSLMQESVSINKHSSTGLYVDRTTTLDPMIPIGVVAVLALAIVLYFFIVRPAQSSTAQGQGMLESLIVNSDNTDEVIIRVCDSFQEDAYSLALALIVRDLHHMASGISKERSLRYCRLAYSVGLILLTTFIQVASLVGTKMYVTPYQVAACRGAYDTFESHMYGTHVYLNANGHKRGIPGFFNATTFDDLTPDVQSQVCNIPLSQLSFIGLILFVWAITCFAQIKYTMETFMALIFLAETHSTMKDALTIAEKDEDRGDDEGAKGCDDGIDTLVITGLTMPVKALIVIFVFLPDLGNTIFVLWLGSRWLVATNDFGNILSNAVALEFILMLKNLLYYALVTSRNKRDLKHTGLKPSWKKEPAGYGIYFTSTVWLVAAAVWVICYIHMQQVLPDYKWDVHEVCNIWLANQLNPNGVSSGTLS